MADFRNYAETEINGNNKFDLIQVMYDEILRNLLYVKKHFIINKEDPYAVRSKQLEERVKRLNKVIDFIVVLKDSVSGGDTIEQRDLALYLDGLYSYQEKNIAEVIMYKSEKKLDETINVFKQMSEAWVETRKKIEEQ
jgi:flagellar secretion chaperone FliS